MFSRSISVILVLYALIGLYIAVSSDSINQGVIIALAFSCVPLITAIALWRQHRITLLPGMLWFYWQILRNVATDILPLIRPITLSFTLEINQQIYLFDAFALIMALILSYFFMVRRNNQGELP